MGIIKRKQCNHDPNSKESSLILLRRRVFIYPPEYDFFCPGCKKFFKFDKGEDGLYIKV